MKLNKFFRRFIRLDFGDISLRLVGVALFLNAYRIMNARPGDETNLPHNVDH